CPLRLEPALRHLRAILQPASSTSPRIDPEARGAPPLDPLELQAFLNYFINHIAVQHVIPAMAKPVNGHELTARIDGAAQSPRDAGQFVTAEVVADFAEDDEVERPRG